MARLTSAVHTVAARPYSVSLASRTASSSSPNAMTESTGPKISSRAMLMSLDTSANSVGATKLPAARSPSAHVRVGEHDRRALAAQLQADPLAPRGPPLHHLSAHPPAAREHH